MWQEIGGRPQRPTRGHRPRSRARFCAAAAGSRNSRLGGSSPRRIVVSCQGVAESERGWTAAQCPPNRKDSTHACGRADMRFHLTCAVQPVYLRTSQHSSSHPRMRSVLELVESRCSDSTATEPPSPAKSLPASRPLPPCRTSWWSIRRSCRPREFPRARLSWPPCWWRSPDATSWRSTPTVRSPSLRTWARTRSSLSPFARCWASPGRPRWLPSSSPACCSS